MLTVKKGICLLLCVKDIRSFSLDAQPQFVVILSAIKPHRMASASYIEPSSHDNQIIRIRELDLFETLILSRWLPSISLCQWRTREGAFETGCSWRDEGATGHHSPMARPMPLLAPVTAATLDWSAMITLSLVLLLLSWESVCFNTSELQSCQILTSYSCWRRSFVDLQRVWIVCPSAFVQHPKKNCDCLLSRRKS